MTHKKSIQDQNYEDYWKLTLGLSNIFGNQFIRTLKLIVDHIDSYKLADKTEKELLNKNKTRLNQKVTHAKELEDNIFKIYPNSDKTGATTRKQINQYIKLGFVKPYLQGYCDAAKEYIKPNQKDETLKRLFSDTVYEYSSFNSSRTKKSPFNQIKFLVQTILNRDDKKLSSDELIGLMNDVRVLKKTYAKENEIKADKAWAKNISFKKRKYNQIRYVCNILSKMSMFEVIGNNLSDTVITLADENDICFPEKGNSKRDPYRFSLMRKAVYEESISIYHKKQCWLTGYSGPGLVVSHLYASATALKNYENDAAYDPQNALLLGPGNPDYHVDKYKLTFDKNGNPIFAKTANPDFVAEAHKKHYKIDKELMTPERCYYMKKHNECFEKKNRQKIN